MKGRHRGYKYFPSVPLFFPSFFFFFFVLPSFGRNSFEERMAAVSQRFKIYLNVLDSYRKFIPSFAILRSLERD